jgi:hypothetical protein
MWKKDAAKYLRLSAEVRLELWSLVLSNGKGHGAMHMLHRDNQGRDANYGA